MAGPRILLIVGGGIAAYKSCELVRMIRKGGGSVTCVLTDGGAKFVTPMALAALSENPVHTTLWDLRNEVEMGHIQLSRQADLIVVCPATANLLAKMAAGIADDLATTLLLATDKPVLVIPAMNVRMWDHAATRRNVETLRDFAARGPDGKSHGVSLRFLRSPVEIVGDENGRVRGIRVARNKLDRDGRPVATGEEELIECGLVFRSIGYRGRPVDGTRSTIAVA